MMIGTRAQSVDGKKLSFRCRDFNGKKFLFNGLGSISSTLSPWASGGCHCDKIEKPISLYHENLIKQSFLVLLHFCHSDVGRYSNTTPNK